MFFVVSATPLPRRLRLLPPSSLQGPLKHRALKALHCESQKPSLDFNSKIKTPSSANTDSDSNIDSEYRSNDNEE